VTVKVANGGTATVRAEGLPIEIARLNAGEALLHTLIDTNIAFLLFVFGIAGIVYEVLHPGLNVAGVVGLLCLIASFVILGMLPVNVAGLILIAAAIGFFVIDLKVAGHGLPTVAGITSLTLGGLFLFNARVPGVHVSRGLVVGVALALAALFFFVVRAAVATRTIAAGGGGDAIVGSLGTVTGTLDPQGIVHVGGEHWTARASEGMIPEGTKVRVLKVQGLTLEVEPAEAATEPATKEEGVR
jgi:membrane-bound serine protease (ClpP class)